jgi:hypothetical protein
MPMHHRFGRPTSGAGGFGLESVEETSHAGEEDEEISQEDAWIIISAYFDVCFLLLNFLPPKLQWFLDILGLGGHMFFMWEVEC